MSNLAVSVFRSCMLTSHTSKPAICRAAAISRSPLLPSSRMTATRGTATTHQQRQYTYTHIYIFITSIPVSDGYGHKFVRHISVLPAYTHRTPSVNWLTWHTVPLLLSIISSHTLHCPVKHLSLTTISSSVKFFKKAKMLLCQILYRNLTV